jgi:LacI family transcriptional regulator
LQQAGTLVGRFAQSDARRLKFFSNCGKPGSVKRRRSVALLIETSNAYARGLLEGVIQYVRHHEAWSIFLPEQERGASPPHWLSRWRGDGIIARIETDEIARAVRATRLPVVDVSAARRVPDIPWVETDDGEIARLAVEHLLERGFRQLGFCGDSSFNWSMWRQQHFARLVAEAGHVCHIYESRPRWAKGYSWNREKRGLANWVRRLPRPIGVMASYDIMAQQLLDVCRELNVAVPEEVAVIGVDNDRLLCDLASPPLSSVIPNAPRTGYEAASLLDQMMSRRPVPPEGHLIQPLGIETRQSTDVLAIDDPDIAEALRFIREQACAGIRVVDVLRHVPLSRRMLESRFRDRLGRTPHQEITRLRIERVKQLLSETDLSLAEIAGHAGFDHVEYLSVVFKREVGVTPGGFRRTARRPR